MKLFLRKICILILIIISLILGISMVKDNDVFNEEKFFEKCGDVEINRANIIDLADDLHNSRLAVLDTVTERPSYDINNFDWNISVEKSPNTFKMYLYALYPVGILLEAYEIDNDVSHLELAKQFVVSFLSTVDTENQDKFFWNDHGAALRNEILIKFALVTDSLGILDEEEKRDIDIFVFDSAFWLADQENYTQNHNHGIYQDRSLLYSVIYLEWENGPWYDLVKERLSKQFEWAYSSEMVHVENSFNYAVVVLNLFTEVRDMYLCLGDDFGEELAKDIDKTRDVLAYMLKPDGNMPQLGDTHYGNLYKNAPYLVRDKDYLTYVLTDGDTGTMPLNHSTIYPEAGYYIWREYWQGEAEKYNRKKDNSTWLLFKAGYLSYTHKHGDDLSIQLYAYGHDIFVDCGYYSYDYDNDLVKYLRSANAHNTIIVDNKSYEYLTLEYADKVGIMDYKINNEQPWYDYISAYNDIYDGVSIERHVYNLGEAYVLYDNILSNDEHVYSQLFQCSDDMEIIQKNDTEVYMKIKDTDYYVRVKQINQGTDLSVYNGQQKGSYYGTMSYAQNQISNISTLKFDQKGTNVDFITLITIEDSTGKIYNIDDIIFDEEMSKFSISKKDGECTLDIKESQRDRSTQTVDIEVDIEKLDDNTYCLTNNTKQGKDISYQYAWYIYDAETGEVIKKQYYSSCNYFKYEIDENKKYLVRSFIKDNNGVKRTSEKIFLN